MRAMHTPTIFDTLKLNTNVNSPVDGMLNFFYVTLYNPTHSKASPNGPNAGENKKSDKNNMDIN